MADYLVPAKQIGGRWRIQRLELSSPEPHDHDDAYAGAAHSHPGGGSHPDLAAHELLGLAAEHEHAYAADDHGHDYAAPHEHPYSADDHAHDTTHTHDYAADDHGHTLIDDDIPAAIARDAEVTSAIATHAGTPHGVTLASVIDALYPVGKIYISEDSTNPGEFLAGTTWEAFGAGRVLIGHDSGDTDFDTAGETGGAKTRAISAHAGATVQDHAALSHSAHTGATVGNHAFTQPTAHGTISAHTGTAVGTSGAGGSHNHSGPSHTHDYTQVPNHVHVQAVNSATTGGLSGYTPDTSTNTSATSGYSTANPTGGVATGTTVAGGTGNTGNESSHTHAAGTVTQPSDHSALTNNHSGGGVDAHSVGQASAHSDHGTQAHTVGQASAHSDVSVVQPYIVVHMFKRTA